VKINEGASTPSSVTIDGMTYYLNKGESIKIQGHIYSAQMTEFHYCVRQHDVADMEHALVDHGANGGINDMHILEGSQRFVVVIGLAGHKVNQLQIVTSQALVSTHQDDVIATFHQMALLGKGASILLCLQMEAHGADINDRSCLLPGGKHFKNGLPYLRCRKPTKNELASLPHIVMTSDVDWDPHQYDKDIDNLEEFHDPSEDVYQHDHFDQYGEYCHCTVATHHTCLEEEFYDA
jgi:hypothetical protein